MTTLAYANLQTEISANIGQLRSQLNRADNALIALVSRKWEVGIGANVTGAMSGIKFVREALKTIGTTTAVVEMTVNGDNVVVSRANSVAAAMKETKKQADVAAKAVANANSASREQRAVGASRAKRIETPYGSIFDPMTQRDYAGQIAAQDKIVTEAHKERAKAAERMAKAEAAAKRNALAAQYRSDGTMASILGGPKNINVTSDAIKRAQREVGLLDEKVGRLDKTGRTVGGTFEMVKNTIFRFAVGYAVIAGVQRGIEELSAATIGYNNTLQTAQIGLTNLLGGNAEGARGLIKDLENFAIRTPFNFQDLVPYTNQLKAVGFELREIMPTIRAVGEAAAGTGLGTEGMNRIIYALGQIKSAGKLAGTEVRQLTEANIPVLKYLAKAYGVTTGEIQKMVSDGLVPADKAIEAIKKGIMQSPKDGGFFGSLEAQSKTFLGALSNVKDALQKTLGEATGPAFQDLTKFTVEMAKVASSDEFAVWAGGTVTGLMKIGTAVGKVTQLLGVLQKVNNSFGLGFFQAKAWDWLVGNTEESVKAQIALRKASNSIHKALSESIDYSAPDAEVVKTITALRGQINDAGTDLSKLRASLDRIGEVKRQITLSTKLGNSTKALLMADLGMTADFVIKKEAILKVKMDEESKGWWDTFLTDLGKGISGVTSAPNYAPEKELGPAKSALEYITGRKAPKLNMSFSGRPDTGRSPFSLSYANTASAVKTNNPLPWLVTPNHGTLKAAADAEQKRGGALAGSLDPNKDILTPPATPGKKTPAQIAAEKLEKDRLQDLIDMNNRWAKSTEDAARRAITAFTKVGDELRGLIGSMQDTLFKQGLGTSALDPFIAKLEKLVNLRGNVNGVAAAAMGKIGGYDTARGSAQSRLDVIGGGDGAGVGYGGTGKAPAWLVSMEQDSGKVFGRNCAEELKARLQKFGIGSVGSLRAASQNKALRVGFDANGRLPAGTIVRYPPGMAGRGQVGNRYGHYQAVGSDQQTWTESNVAGRDKISARARAIDWAKLQRDVGAGRALAYAPRGALAAGAVAGGAMPSGVGRRASGDAVSFAQELMNLNPSLSKLSALPKAWGPFVKDAAGNTARWAAQLMLADKATAQLLRNQLGDKGFAKVAALLRQAANETDRLSNAETARQAAFGRSRDLDAKGRMRGQENNPLAELNEYFGQDAVGKNTPARERAVLVAKTLKDVLDDAALATKRFVGAQRDQMKALMSGEPLLRGAMADTYGYQRTVDLATERIRIWNSLEKERNANAKEGNDLFRKQYAAFIALYDAQKAAARTSENQGAIQTLKERLWLLVEEGKSLANVAMNLTDVNDLSEKRKSILDATNALFALGHERKRAGELATQRAEMEAGVKAQERRNQLDREWREIQLDTQRTVELSEKQIGIFGSTVAGSREQEYQLARAEKYLDLQKQMESGAFGKVGALGEKLRRQSAWEVAYAATEKSTISRNENQANLNSRNAVLGAENNLLTRQLELRGQMNDVRRQEMEYALDTLQRAGTTSEVTAQEVIDRTRILDLMRQTAALDVGFAQRDAEREIALSRAAPGYLRDRMQRGFELSDGGKTPEQIAAIQNADEVIRKTREQTQLMDSLWGGARDTIAQTIGGIQKDGIAGFKGLFDGILGGLQQFAQQFLTNTIWNKILAMTGGGGPQVTKTNGGGFDLGSLISTGIGLFAGGGGSTSGMSGFGPVANGAAYGGGLSSMNVGRAMIAPRSAMVGASAATGSGDTYLFPNANFSSVRSEKDIPSAVRQNIASRPPRSQQRREVAQQARAGSASL